MSRKRKQDNDYIIKFDVNPDSSIRLIWDYPEDEALISKELVEILLGRHNALVEIIKSLGHTLQEADE